MIKIEREDNGRKGRFVIYENDVFAGEKSYVWAGKPRFIIDHTFVEPNFSGRGFGEQLVTKSCSVCPKQQSKNSAALSLRKKSIR